MDDSHTWMWIHILCLSHRRTFAGTSQLFHNKSISFKDTNSCGYNRQYTEVQQYWWRSKGLTVCTGTYRDWVCSMKAATITRFQPELQLQNCQVTRFTHKEPRARIFMWKFPYISTLAPTFLNMYRPNNTCLKSLWQSVFSSGFTITLKIQDKKSSY